MQKKNSQNIHKQPSATGKLKSGVDKGGRAKKMRVQ